MTISSKRAPSADAKAASRLASADDMRARCGIEQVAPKPLTAGQRSCLKQLPPAERDVALAKLKGRR